LAGKCAARCGSPLRKQVEDASRGGNANGRRSNKKAALKINFFRSFSIHL
jgi:hypothetical protein